MSKQDILLFDEAVREILMALGSLGSNLYMTDYAFDQLNKRPEPIEQKIQALKKADEITKDKNPTFNRAVEKLLTKYATKTTPVKVSLPHRPYPNRPLPKPTHKITPMDTSLSFDREFLDFVKSHEKFTPNRYWDYSQYSIGYGSKAKPGENTITKQEAHNRLVDELKPHKKAVLKAAKKWGYDWTPNQINALTSFRYNVGNIGGLTKNGARDNKTIARKILEYDKAGGKSLGGLTKRRTEEYHLFTSK